MKSTEDQRRQVSFNEKSTVATVEYVGTESLSIIEIEKSVISTKTHDYKFDSSLVSGEDKPEYKIPPITTHAIG